MSAPKDCGLLNRADARAWKHWWTVRGHIATLTATGRRGLFRCTLMLTRRDEVSQ